MDKVMKKYFSMGFKVLYSTLEMIPFQEVQNPLFGKVQLIEHSLCYIGYGRNNELTDNLN